MSDLKSRLERCGDEREGERLEAKIRECEEEIYRWTLKLEALDISTASDVDKEGRRNVLSCVCVELYSYGLHFIPLQIYLGSF